MSSIRLMVVVLLIKDGFCLFFILLGSVFSKKIFKYCWNKYKVYDTPPGIFNLCVNWLLYKGNKYNMTYQSINIVIFCIIWPLITIISLMFNVSYIIS